MPLSFENDIRPLFRDRDRGAMKRRFDLWSVDDVRANAPRILAAVEQGRMPCDEAWPKTTSRRSVNGSMPAWRRKESVRPATSWRRRDVAHVSSSDQRRLPRVVKLQWPRRDSARIAPWRRLGSSSAVTARLASLSA